MSYIMPLCRWLARPVLLFYALPWLIVLLIAGTLAQAEIGLYAAHQHYFAAWVLWWGYLPLPGTYLTLTLITLSLSAKFVLGSPWKAAKLGTTLTHLGVLVLLYGGMITALTQQEGFMVITEGAQADTTADYHARVLKIYQDEALAMQIPFDRLTVGQAVADIPFSLTPRLLCANCSAEEVADDDTDMPRHGMAEKVELRALPREKENELNLSGMMFDVTGTATTDGRYATLEDVPMIPRFEKDGHVYGVQMGRRVSALPFSIELVDFARDNYPGSDEARAYHSDIIVHDGPLSWPVRIEMNAPLRYQGYTLYQASYGMTPDGRERTVLSVVRNKGWLFPYLASAIIFAGLCVHLFQRFSRGRSA